jgi:hypothetical protein
LFNFLKENAFIGTGFYYKDNTGGCAYGVIRLHKKYGYWKKRKYPPCALNVQED